MVKSDSVHRRSHHLGHTATAHCERARGKPKQQVQFIFNSKFTVMHALLKSVFGLSNFDMGLCDCCCCCLPTQLRQST